MLYEDKAKCCGCTACYAICPTEAIAMCPDEEGFLYPVIDNIKCIQCKACEEVCPLKSDRATSAVSDFPKFIAVKHNNTEVKLSSSSGGAFTAISDYVLDNGGVVYGVVFDESLRAIHTRAENRQMRDKMRVSKYVQSDMEDTFRQVKKDLSSGLSVLFTGTPCQVAGLKNFLKKDYDNLITCDVICHGVPSPLMFSEHIKHIEKVKRKKAVNYICRSKVNSWHRHIECMEFADGKIEFGTPLLQEHKVLFYAGYILRPTCYECSFTNLNRPSDLSLGDFWGIENSMPDWDDHIGTSIILINTTKGEEIFKKIESVVQVRESETYGRQPHLERSASKPSDRQLFWEEYKKHGYSYIVAKYGRNGLVDRLKYSVKKLLKK